MKVICKPVFLITLMICFRGMSTDIRVGLYHPYLVTSLMLSCSEGSYLYSFPDGILKELNKGQAVFLKIYDDDLWLRDEKHEWVRMTNVNFVASTDQSIFRLKPGTPVLPSREYLGNLEVKPFHNSIQLINVLDMEKYLMGVVETEGGPSAPIGFYKVQAIICRTYAIKNFGKHLAEGYNICDEVHCQSYKGRHQWNEDVEIAVDVTEGIIITDMDSVPVIAVYHSNSGGETEGAENIWLTEAPYLRPVLDPFSVDQANFRWEKVIKADLWFSYLREKGFNIPGKVDTMTFESIQQHREKFYLTGTHILDYRKIREDWNLRSSYFSVLYRDGYFVLKGKGYGHGVGLSQEGAMNMARKGYHYTEILNFYYHNIMITSYHYLEVPGLTVPGSLNLDKK